MCRPLSLALAAGSRASGRVVDQCCAARWARDGRRRLPAQTYPAAYLTRPRACTAAGPAPRPTRSNQGPGRQLRPAGLHGQPLLPAAPPPRPPCAPRLHAGCTADLAAGPVFVVSEVLNASGGRTGCFLYRGRLVSAAPRAATPDYCCPALHSGEGVLAGVQEVPQLAQCDGEQQELLQYEGQQLTLYFRCVGGRMHLGAGWVGAGARSRRPLRCCVNGWGRAGLAACPLLCLQAAAPAWFCGGAKLALPHWLAGCAFFPSSTVGKGIPHPQPPGPPTSHHPSKHPSCG